jgi:integrase
MRSKSSKHPGVYPRHGGWQAKIKIGGHGGKVLSETFPSLAAAKAWRHDALSKANRGELRPSSGLTLQVAADAWLKGAEGGTITNRSGDRYKPSVPRSYEAALRLRVLPELGRRKLSDVSRLDLQDLVDRLVAQGTDPATIMTTITPLRALYRWHLVRGEVAINPTAGLELPAVRGKRDRIVAPEYAARLIAALPIDDRALWATAFYAGTRRGELMALRSCDVDLSPGGVISIERGWDATVGPIAPKSGSRRTVPIAAALRLHLLEHRMRSGRSEGLVFGRTADAPFHPTMVTNRAREAWKVAGLQGLTLHECRHTFASFAIAAGANAKTLSTYMGHANISITLDRYGHLMPGSEKEFTKLLDSYLEDADKRASEA